MTPQKAQRGTRVPIIPGCGRVLRDAKGKPYFHGPRDSARYPWRVYCCGEWRPGLGDELNAECSQCGARYAYHYRAPCRPRTTPEALVAGQRYQAPRAL